jgi:hypothetical protein
MAKAIKICMYASTTIHNKRERRPITLKEEKKGEPSKSRGALWGKGRGRGGK